MIHTIPYQSLDSENQLKILKWRNNERIRIWMKDQDPIDKYDHLDFVNNLVNEKDRHYFLVKKNDVEIGTINLIRKNKFLVEGGLFKNPDLNVPAGKNLMSALEREAVKHGYKTIQLEVQEKIHVLFVRIKIQAIQ